MTEDINRLMNERKQETVKLYLDICKIKDDTTMMENLLKEHESEQVVADPVSMQESAESNQEYVEQELIRRVY